LHFACLARDVVGLFIHLRGVFLLRLVFQRRFVILLDFRPRFLPFRLLLCFLIFLLFLQLPFERALYSLPLELHFYIELAFQSLLAVLDGGGD